MPILIGVSMFSWAVRNGAQQEPRAPVLPEPSQNTPQPLDPDADLDQIVEGEPDAQVLLLPRAEDGTLEFVITHANAAAMALLHLRPEDLGAATLGAVIPSLVSRRLPAMCLQVWRTGQAMNLADVLWTSAPMEGPSWVDLRVRRLFGHLSVLVLDLTERHRQQEEFAAGEARYRTLAANAADVVFQTRGRNRLAWVSPGIRDALGYCPSEVVGREMPDLIHPDDAPDCSNDPRLPLRFEARFRHADRHWVWLRVVTRSEYDDDGRVIGQIGSAQDVSQDKADAEHLRSAQTRLRQEKNRLRAILDAALDPHVVLSAVHDETGRVHDLRFEECNRAAEDYLGRTRADLLGVRVGELYGPETANTAVGWARRVLATGTPLILRDRQLYSEIAQCLRRVDVSMVRLDDGVSFTWRDLDEGPRVRRG